MGRHRGRRRPLSGAQRTPRPQPAGPRAVEPGRSVRLAGGGGGGAWRGCVGVRGRHGAKQDIEPLLQRQAESFAWAANALHTSQQELLAMRCDGQAILRMALHHGSRPCDQTQATRARTHSVPRFDVGGAIDVLSTGALPGLPTVITDQRTPMPPPLAEDREALDHVTRLLRLRVLAAGLPAALKHVETGVWHGLRQGGCGGSARRPSDACSFAASQPPPLAACRSDGRHQ